MERDAIKGHVILLMAPSGSGKRMLIESLGELADELYFAKTYTSRKPREGAEENSRYNFVSREEFQSMIDEGSFIEWAEYSGNFYGTPKSEFIEPLQNGSVVFKEMELIGVQQIRKLIPKENLTVAYVEAGGWEDLKERILKRASISDEELELRRQRYEEEAKFKPEADVIIENYNGEFEKSSENFRSFIKDTLAKVK